jgi:uncharacterized repeat protein (TIGR02059 family)
VLKRAYLYLATAIALLTQLVSIGANPSFAASYTYSNSSMTDYYVNATAGQTFTAYTQKAGGDPYLTLFSPTGAVATYNDDGYGNLDSYINNYTFPTTGTYRLNAGQCCTADRAWSGASYTIYITTGATVSTTNVDTTAPTISSISINNNAGADGTYIAGDVITATVTWSENVTITGTPRIPIQGLSSKYLSFASGSGTTSTTFTYSVASGDNDADGIAISLNTLELNGGTVKDGSNNIATLTHSAVAASTSQKVDTTAPSFSSASTNSAGTQVILTYGEALSSTAPSTSTFSVIVEGSSVTVSTVTTSGSTVIVTVTPAIKSAQVVTVAYTDPTSGNDVNAVQDLGGNDGTTLASTSVTNISTVKQTQATLSLSGGATRYGVPLLLLATGGSGTGALSYSVVSGPCTITNVDSLTATGVGTCAITATKATDTDYLSITSASANYVISRGISTASVALTPGSFIFRQSKDVTAVGSVAGKITFKVNDEFIAGCRNLLINASNNYTATCPYKPSVRGSVVINVVLVPHDSNYSGTASSTARFFIYNRVGKR